MPEFNRATYKATRISLGLMLGKSRRNALMDRLWADSYAFPKPIIDVIPAHLRRKWAEDRWIRTMDAEWGRDHEARAIDLMGRIHGHLFVDVGANYGVYCRKLEKNFERIIAIEAHPEIYRRLKQVCPANCEAINAAVSNVEGTVNFYGVEELTPMHLGEIMSGSIFPGEREWKRHRKPEKAFKVHALPMSKILTGEKEIDLVKVDAEGAEWVVLEGAETIMPRIKRWMIELHEPAKRAELEARMRRYGYDKCEWLEPLEILAQRSTR
jgi:FkbM family methyltransferase